MSFTLENVVPWGRSFAEYCQMFALTDSDLMSSRILGCADGPASFNAEANQKSYKVVSCDPLYQFSEDQILKRIREAYRLIMDQLYQNQGDFVWTHFKDPRSLGQCRLGSMERFLTDFSEGKETGRYICASLPQLPFSEKHFDLALCSHFLFTYSDTLSQNFHLEAIQELCRVSDSVRIFPLLKIDGTVSEYLDTVRGFLEKKGFETKIVPVSYEFQKNGNEALFINSIS